MIILRKSGSLGAVWIKSLAPAAWCSFCSGSESCRTNFTMTHYIPKSCIKILDTVVFGIPRLAFSSRTVSHWSLLVATHTHSTFSGGLHFAGFPKHGSLSPDPQPSLKHLCHTLFVLHSLHHPPKPSNHPNSFQRGMFKLNAQFDADSCSTCLVILNVTATLYTCSVSSIYHPTD